MVNIIRYINDLLYLHECVIIPGFGGFVTNYKPSRLDEKRGVFYPPTKEISFNRSLTKNDGLLVNWLVQHESISYENANKIISYFVEDIKVKLNQGHRVVFENVGIVYSNRHSNILFEPVNYNFLTESWGMEEVLVSPVENSNYISGVTTSIGKWVKYGLIASIIGGGIFFIDDNADKFRKKSINIPEEASIAPINLFPKINNRQLKPVISHEDELVDYDPIADMGR